MKKNRTPLLTSILMIILCSAILVGATYAQFTDNVQSNGNVIQTGNLSAELSHWAVDGNGNADWADASTKTIFSYSYWEPNFTDVQYIKIRNAGKLAFQYKLNIIPVTPATEGPNLMDVIDVYYGVLGEGVQPPADPKLSENFYAFAENNNLTKLGTLTQLNAMSGNTWGVMLPEGSNVLDNVELPDGVTAYEGDVQACIVLHMQETAGNEYQGLTAGGGFNLQLSATQYTYEKDSFDQNYDSEADFPELTQFVNKFQAIDPAPYFGTLPEGGITKTLGDLFQGLENADIDSAIVHVNISGANAASWQYAPNADDWTQGTLTFTGNGVFQITISEDQHCAPVTITAYVGVSSEPTDTPDTPEPTPEDIFVAQKDSFEYNNQNKEGASVKLGDLFSAKDTAEINDVAVVVHVTEGNITHDISEDGSWSDRTITFGGYGTAIVTISAGENSNPVTATVTINTNKFTAKVKEEQEGNYPTGTSISLGDLFDASASEYEDQITKEKVEITVTPVTRVRSLLDETGAEELYTFDKTGDTWKDYTLTFKTEGNWNVTITEDKYCIPETAIISVAHANKFEAKEESFTYETTGEIQIAIGDLFAATNQGTIDSVAVSVSVQPDEENVTLTKAGEWEEWSLTIEGTGVYTVSITDGDYCVPATCQIIVTEPEAVKKFTAIDLQSVTAGSSLTLSQLFNVVEDADIAYENIVVTISSGNDEKTIENLGEAWGNHEITFANAGDVVVTITDGKYCVPATCQISVTEPEAVKKFTAIDLQSVTAGSSLTLSQLFGVIEGAEISYADIVVTISRGEDEVETIENLGEAWGDQAIAFENHGDVVVTITDNDYCIETSNTVTVSLAEKFAVQSDASTEYYINQEIILSDLFEDVNPEFSIEDADVVIEVNGTPLENEEATEWTWKDQKITIESPGTVEVTISHKYCVPVTVTLTVKEYDTKFVAKTDALNAQLGGTLTLGDLFDEAEGAEAKINPASVVAIVTCGDYSKIELTGTETGWKELEFSLENAGTYTVTITDDVYCKEASTSFVINKVQKFAVKNQAGHSAYIGDEITLGDLFDDMLPELVLSGEVKVTIGGEPVNINSTEWESYQLDSTEVKVVEVTISHPNCESATVELTIKDLDEKFTATELKEVTVGKAVKLNELFTPVPGAAINSNVVTVTVLDVDAGAYEYNAQPTNWQESTLTFKNEGTVTVTIQEDVHCKPASTTITVNLPESTKKFSLKFPNIDDYLYRVGNGNAVALGSLFEAVDGAEIGTVTVSVDAQGDTKASGSYTANDSNWTKGTIQFNDTGIVKVSIEDDNYCKPTELLLEVVDAKNAISATSAKENNVVLLNDCNFSTIEVSNGYTLYGNGFTITCQNDQVAADMSYAYVALNNGTLDNVQVQCPDYSLSIMYDSQAKEPDNVDPTAEWRYKNIRSAVTMGGNSKILNSRISGGRAAVYVPSGYAVIENSTIQYGALANIHVGTAQSLTLKDVTLVQEPKQATVNDTSKTLMGLSVVFTCGGDGSSTPLTLEGELIQYAWANESFAKYAPYGTDSIVTKLLKENNFKHTMSLAGDESDSWMNLGFAYMPEDIGKSVGTPTINDNRGNRETVPYGAIKPSVLGTTAYVYSYKNSEGTDDSFKVEPEYASEHHDPVLPTVSFEDTAEDKVFMFVYDEQKGWTSTLTVVDVAGSYTFDFNNLKVQKYGKDLEYTVTDDEGKLINKTEKIELTDSGTYNYVLNVTDKFHYDAFGNHQERKSTTLKIPFTLTATISTIDPPEKVAEVGGTPLLVAKGYNSDWSCALPALEGTQIKYWSVADKEYKTLTLSDLTPTSTGKQNGTNNSWTYSPSNKDYTLTVTCGVIHEGKSVYGMPVVVNNGGNKMYFTISSTNGYVSTSTAARTVTVSYEFKDNNGGTLKFDKNWNFNRQAQIDAGAKQYSYNDFVKGELTELSGGGSSSGCVTPGTLITLADGTRKRVDSLTGDEQLLVWNMETGALDAAPILFVDSEPETECEVVTLCFSDGTAVKVIYEHGFWDYDLNKYVYLDENAAQYIGHSFFKHSGNGGEKVQLTDVVIEKETTTALSPVTAGHLCYFVNDMLSMPGGVGGLFNIFDVNPATMTYDMEAMAHDIATYGLFTYEELSNYVELPEEMFNAAGGAYLKVSIGKGNLTMDELIAMIQRYAKFF